MALVQVEDSSSPWKKFLPYIGPGILVSVAYLDPGNLETDLNAGANHKYELLWIVIVGLSFALLIQSRSANLGVATGKHLSEHCKREYPNLVNYVLWVIAEIAVIAADIPEVIGTAFALNILFNAPIWAGVLLAGLNTLLLLGLQRYGIRKLEFAIGILVLVVGGCFFSVIVHARPNPREVIMGMFIPKLKSGNATRDAVALLGALIMPSCDITKNSTFYRWNQDCPEVLHVRKRFSSAGSSGHQCCSNISQWKCLLKSKYLFREQQIL